MTTHSVEDIKSDSKRLRGALLDSLADPLTGAVREDDTPVIKYHGSYQQDDRDLRDERRRQKLVPAFQFMIRTRNEAVSQALAYAKRQHVRAWFAKGDDDFLLLGTFREERAQPARSL